MKTVVKISLIFIATCLFSVQVIADEKDFGKAAPTESEIIEHFKSSIPEVEASPNDNNDYQDVSEGDIKNVRGLKRIDSIDKKTGRKRVLPTTIAENAISLQVLFDYNSAILSEQAKAQLEPVGRALASGDLSGMKFRIEGHTDIVGSDEFNIELSRRRAEAVKQFLTEKYGIASAVIQIEGKGKNNLADSANPTGEANRRVRIVSLGK